MTVWVMKVSNSIEINRTRMTCLRRRCYVRSSQVTIAIRSSSRVIQIRKSKMFFYSREENLFITALSSADATLSINPSME